MKERPILFSSPMVRAILDGRKVQTRRLVKPQPAHSCRYEMNGAGDKALHIADGPRSGAAAVRKTLFVPVKATSADHRLSCPYGAPGDRLWVREAWQKFAYGYDPISADRFGGEFAPFVGVCNGTPLRWRACYSADGPLEHPTDGHARWRPSIHMPRWASRITLEVTGLRVQRLQDISEEDARAEGVQLHEGAPMCPCHGEEEDPGPHHLPTCAWRDKDFDPTGSPYRDEFAILWNTINGKRAPWASNPWAWVVEFKRVEQEAKAA